MKMSKKRLTELDQRECEIYRYIYKLQKIKMKKEQKETKKRKGTTKGRNE